MKRKYQKLKGKYCSHCGDTDGPFVKHCLTRGRQYFYCRNCNTERLRRYRKTYRGKLNTRKATAKSQRKYPIHQNARNMLNYYLRVGKIKKPNKCELCKRAGFVEAHHPDYRHPLDVVWVCEKCHLVI